MWDGMDLWERKSISPFFPSFLNVNSFKNIWLIWSTITNTHQNSMAFPEKSWPPSLVPEMQGKVLFTSNKKRRNHSLPLPHRERSCRSNATPLTHTIKKKKRWWPNIYFLFSWCGHEIRVTLEVEEREGFADSYCGDPWHNFLMLEEFLQYFVPCLSRWTLDRE